jgi:predicted RecA/RadA family phage recombinase
MSALRVTAPGAIDYTPVAKAEAGTVVVLGGIVGVVLREIAAGELGALATDGVFSLDLATGKTFEAGDAVYVASSEATDAGTFFGWAVADSAGGKVSALLVQSIPTESP